MSYSPLPDQFIRLDKQNCTKGKTIQCGNACRKPENCKSKTGGQYTSLLAKKRAAMKAQRKDPSKMSDRELMAEIDRTAKAYSKGVDKLKGEVSQFKQATMGFTGAINDLAVSAEKLTGGQRSKDEIKPFNRPVKMSPEKELQVRQQVQSAIEPESLFNAKLKKGDLEGAIDQSLLLADQSKKMAQQTSWDLKGARKQVKDKTKDVLNKYPLIGESPTSTPKRKTKAIEISNLRNAIAETEAMIKAKKDQEGTPLDKATIAAMRRAVVYQRAHLQRLGEGERSAKGKSESKKSQEGLTEKEKKMGVEVDFKGRKTFRGLTIDSMIPDEYVRVSRGDAKATPAQKKKIGDVMGEFKDQQLHSGKSKKKVKSRKQAIAIALSEAGLSRKDSIDSDPYIRIDAGKCTPGKTVKCGNVCRTPVNCKKGKPGSERVKAIGKEQLSEFAAAQKAKRQPKAIEKTEPVAVAEPKPKKTRSTKTKLTPPKTIDLSELEPPKSLTVESEKKNFVDAKKKIESAAKNLSKDLSKSIDPSDDRTYSNAVRQIDAVQIKAKKQINQAVDQVNRALKYSSANSDDRLKHSMLWKEKGDELIKKINQWSDDQFAAADQARRSSKLAPPKTIAPAKPEPYEPESKLTAGQREHLNRIMTNTEPVKGQLGLFGGEEKPKAVKETRSSGGEGSGRSKAWEELAAKVATEKPDRTGFTKTQKAYVAGQVLKAMNAGDIVETPKLSQTGLATLQDVRVGLEQKRLAKKPLDGLVEVSVDGYLARSGINQFVKGGIGSVPKGKKNTIVLTQDDIKKIDEITKANKKPVELDIPGGGQYKIPRTTMAINNFLKGLGIKPDDLSKTAIKVDSSTRTDSWGVDILRQWWNDRLSLDLSTCYALRTV